MTRPSSRPHPDLIVTSSTTCCAAGLLQAALIRTAVLLRRRRRLLAKLQVSRLVGPADFQTTIRARPFVGAPRQRGGIRRGTSRRGRCCDAREADGERHGGLSARARSSRDPARAVQNSHDFGRGPPKDLRNVSKRSVRHPDFILTSSRPHSDLISPSTGNSSSNRVAP